MRVGQYCYPRYLYLFPYFSSTMHVRIDGDDCGQDGHDYLFIVLLVRDRDCSTNFHETFKYSQEFCIPILQQGVKKFITTTTTPRQRLPTGQKVNQHKFSPTTASLHHRQPSISSFANLLPQIAAKSSVSFSFKVNSIKKYLR